LQRRTHIGAADVADEDRKWYDKFAHAGISGKYGPAVKATRRGVEKNALSCPL
jgi:hypothetical protein